VTYVSYAFEENSDKHIAKPRLGLSALDSYPSSSDYWLEVYKQLQILPRVAAERGRPISQLVLMGENADMPEFIKVLKDALTSPWKMKGGSLSGDGDEETPKGVLLEEDKLQANLEKMADPLWAAARGAALYARWRQELPWDCEELPECLPETVDSSDDGNQMVLGVDEL
jgi:hypothetical protein